MLFLKSNVNFQNLKKLESVNHQFGWSVQNNWKMPKKYFNGISKMISKMISKVFQKLFQKYFKNDFKSISKIISKVFKKRQVKELKIIVLSSSDKHIGFGKFETILMAFKNGLKNNQTIFKIA